MRIKTLTKLITIKLYSDIILYCNKSIRTKLVYSPCLIPTLNTSIKSCRRVTLISEITIKTILNNPHNHSFPCEWSSCALLRFNAILIIVKNNNDWR